MFNRDYENLKYINYNLNISFYEGQIQDCYNFCNLENG